jgi:hypothetical protein
MSTYGSRPDLYAPTHDSATGAPYRSDYSSTDRFASRDFVGQDTSGARNHSYPPTREVGEKEFGYENKGISVTRGSIAAQVSLMFGTGPWRGL